MTTGRLGDEKRKAAVPDVGGLAAVPCFRHGFSELERGGRIFLPSEYPSAAQRALSPTPT